MNISIHHPLPAAGRVAAVRGGVGCVAHGPSRSRHPAGVPAGIGAANRPFKRAFAAI